MIPAKTKSETVEDDKIVLAELFGSESLSDIDFNGRKKRKSEFQSIDDLLESEFSLGSQSNMLTEDTYKFKLLEDIPNELSPPPVTQDKLVPEYKMVLKNNFETSQVSSDPKPEILSQQSQPSQSARQVATTSTRSGKHGKKKSMPKQQLNNNIKKSLRKGQADRRVLQQSVRSMIQKLAVSENAKFYFDFCQHVYCLEANSFRLSSSREKNLLRVMGSLAHDHVLSSNDYLLASSATFEIQYYKVEELSKKSFRSTFSFTPQEHCTSCGASNFHKAEQQNHLLCFNEGYVVNICTVPNPTEGTAAERIVKVELLASPGNEEEAPALVREVEAFSEQLRWSGRYGLEWSHIDTLFRRMRAVLQTKENAPPNGNSSEVSPPVEAKDVELDLGSHIRSPRRRSRSSYHGGIFLEEI